MIQQVVANFRLADLADILIVAGLFYWSIALIRGTRAVQMLIGLGFVGLLGFAGTALQHLAGVFDLARHAGACHV